MKNGHKEERSQNVDAFIQRNDLTYFCLFVFACFVCFDMVPLCSSGWLQTENRFASVP